jgi:hypothetical protein
MVLGLCNIIKVKSAEELPEVLLPSTRRWNFPSAKRYATGGLRCHCVEESRSLVEQSKMLVKPSLDDIALLPSSSSLEVLPDLLLSCYLSYC